MIEDFKVYKYQECEDDKSLGTTTCELKELPKYVFDAMMMYGNGTYYAVDLEDHVCYSLSGGWQE